MTTPATWTWEGRVMIRPLDRGIVLEDEGLDSLAQPDLADVLADFLRAGRSVTGTEHAIVRITVERLDRRASKTSESDVQIEQDGGSA